MQVIMLVMMLSYANMCHRGVDAAVDVDHDGGIGNDGDAKLGYGVPTSDDGDDDHDVGIGNDDVAKLGYGVTTGGDGDDDHDVGIGNNDDVGDDAKLGYGVPTRGRWKQSFCWKLELDSKFQPGTVTA